MCRGGLSSGVFSPLVRGGINFSWQSHAAVIWFKGRCYYPDLPITAGDWIPDWQLDTLFLKTKGLETVCSFMTAG